MKTNKKDTRIARPIQIDLIIYVFKSVPSSHKTISLKQIFTRRQMFVSEYFYRKINITPGTVNNFSPPRHLSSITGMHRLFVIQIKRQRTTVPSI